MTLDLAEDPQNFTTQAPFSYRPRDGNHVSSDQAWSLDPMTQCSGPTTRTSQEEPKSTLDRFRDNLSGTPMSDRIGIKFSIPPTPHVEYRPDHSGPTNIWDLAFVVQKTNEMVRQFWTHFLFVKNKIPDCSDQEAISAFRHNVYDEGIGKAISRKHLWTFAELSDIVDKILRYGGRLVGQSMAP